jgi:DNA replication protein DnaC
MNISKLYLLFQIISTKSLKTLKIKSYICIFYHQKNYSLMSNIPNPQIEMAFEYVQNTNKNIFLTGKAGTGKTTFLHRIKRRSLKRLAIVAPTGVAAINAKGMTIHSLFQLPFGAFLPGIKNENQRKFSGQKIKLIKSLDLLIIDEISMVRADLLDAID